MTLTPAWLVALQFGVTSEVWMHRQARCLRRLALRVATLDYREPDRFPAEGFELTEIEPRTRLPGGVLRAQAYLAWCRIANRRLGGFRGAPAEAEAWRRLYEVDRPRVALCHYGTTAVRMAPLFNSLGLPVVAHFNGFDLSSALRGFNYRRNLARLAPRFAACVVVADYMRDWLVEHGCDPARVHKIPYGAPMAELPVADRLGDQPARFVMVGRLTDKKRPDLTLRAFAVCRETHPDARLVVVGDGPLMEECRRLAAELALGTSVEWLGSQPIDEVKRRLAAASAFVQHSVTAASGDKEGWPVAIAEAAGAGLPVIATRHASIPEQVEDGRTGLLVDEGDWRGMGEAMSRLASDPGERVRMGAAAREKLAPFETASQAHALEDLLLAVAAGKHP